ncbi:MAG: hypothetical protein KME20_23655 [Kaiparowitsia implicata GSE-PSE-MK54-09C]|nr:hypothetical protein [Kaiparowitsia implicata GSE-PSE-MK54-09C]
MIPKFTVQYELFRVISTAFHGGTGPIGTYGVFFDCAGDGAIALNARFAD